MKSDQSGHLILAGGGHTHALILKKWAMKPWKRPKGIITLISDSSTSLYSGMVPGVIAKLYTEKEASIDLRRLCQQAKVCFIKAKIKRIDLKTNSILLEGRDPIQYKKLSINIGSITNRTTVPLSKQGVGIKPLPAALNFIKEQDAYADDPMRPFTVIGGGPAGIEIILALRKRWQNRPLHLHSRRGQTCKEIKAILESANIEVHENSSHYSNPADTLLCTGSKTDNLLYMSGLNCDSNGRVITTASLQTVENPDIFASGDCGVIKNQPRPASGVWAVRAANTLGQNLERACKGEKLIEWKPQRRSLQLLSIFVSPRKAQSIAMLGNWNTKPSEWMWKIKRKIDENFVAQFSEVTKIKMNQEHAMKCRGCAAKVSGAILERSLQRAELLTSPKDAARLDRTWIQSVDGFPAIINDPWLNGRLTAMHACSDIWASGANVHSIQAIVTVPETQTETQEYLIEQSLRGINSSAAPQNAAIIGGHTLETRDSYAEPKSAGVQLNLCVNGVFETHQSEWGKGGLRPQDSLIISRQIGSGVLFAASMTGHAEATWIDQVLDTMQTSQHTLVKQLREIEQETTETVHACTDITGFGLLGHLGEMLNASDHSLQANLKTNEIPVYEGSLELLRQGFSSSLAPSNRSSWQLLDSKGKEKPKIIFDIAPELETLELVVDPQTCGPLLVGCSKYFAQIACAQGPWVEIGTIKKTA